MTRPRRFLLFTATLLGLCLCGAAVYLYFFDLNDYRRTLENKISSALSLPVHLGEARFTLEPGPTFSFSDLRIGSVEGETEGLHAERILFKLEILPLFLGRLALKDVVLDHPHLRHYLVPAEIPADAATSPRALFDVGVLSGASIKSLSIEQGRLDIIDQRQPDHKDTAVLQDIDLNVENIASGKTGTITFRTALIHGENHSTINLSGTISVPAVLSDWQKTRMNLALRVADLAMEPILSRAASLPFNVKASGRLSVQLKGSGSPAEGLDFQADLEGEECSLHLPDLYRSPFPLKHIEIKGRWQTSQNEDSLTDLQLSVNDLAVKGNATLSGQEGVRWLRGDLSSGKLPVKSLLSFIPDLHNNLATFATRIHRGSLQLLSTEFSLPLPPGEPTAGALKLNKVLLLFEDGSAQISPEMELDKIAGRLHLDDDLLELEGTSEVQGQKIDFVGAVKDPLRKNRRLSLSLSGNLDADFLTSKLPASKRGEILLQGTLPVSISSEGILEDLQINLHADLSNLALDWGNTLQIPAEPDNALSLALALYPDRLELLQGALDVSPLSVRGKGQMKREENNPLHGAIEVAGLDLARLRQRLPWMERLNPRGQASLHLELDGTPQKTGITRGELLLDNVGVHLTRAIADLNEISGKVVLYSSHAQGKNLSLKLGESPLNANVRLHSYREFRLQVDVRGDAVYARDIIFPSDKAILHDIAGRLNFDRAGLVFDPVNVRLEQGTHATVRGRIQWAGAPSVRLDIESPDANIDEVIGLWQNGSREEREGTAPPEAGRKKVAVEISAKAATGTLGNLHFTEAAGTIWVQDHLLGISPLTFTSGKGFCTGQVLVDSRQGRPALLRISGHMENFDAAAIYKEMLGQRGLVTGTMRSDFYLEGRAGETFLKSSLGGFNLEINDGVLRQFKTLSKVFSLLNVSQIFSLRLPDMAKEGMPFDHLQASVAMTQGVLNTEDLFIESNAMNLSVVGNFSLIDDKMDMILGIKPLRTVDKIVTNIPLAGWLLTGEDKALITAQFKIGGTGKNPEVTAIPISSLSDTVLGIFKRTLSLPGKVITDLESLGGSSSK